MKTSGMILVSLLVAGLLGCTDNAANPPAVDEEVAETTPTPTQPTDDSLAIPRQRALNYATATFLSENGNPMADDPVKQELVDLNQDGALDALVLLGSSNWCGSGGCTMLVFQGPDDSSLSDPTSTDGFQLVSQITLIQEPVMVSKTTTNGWRDLIVDVSGGGATPGKVALTFDGSTYPTNPSVVDPLPANADVKGDSIFSPDQPFRAIGDNPVWEAACRDGIASKYSVSPDTITLNFARSDEGGAAYGYTLANGTDGTCRAVGEGTVEYIEETP